MDETILKVKGFGESGTTKAWNQLSEFVMENFDLLYYGACRIDANIPDDYYAPRRIQINSTRLHLNQGLKIAAGHHLHDDKEPEERHITEAISDIQKLLDVAGEDRPLSYIIRIEAI
jgi:hypothetical protein